MDKAIEALAYHRAKRNYDKYALAHSAEQCPTWDQIDQDSRDWYARSQMATAKEDVELIAPILKEI